MFKCSKKVLNFQIHCYLIKCQNKANTIIQTSLRVTTETFVIYEIELILWFRQRVFPIIISMRNTKKEADRPQPKSKKTLET